MFHEMNELNAYNIQSRDNETFKCSDLLFDEEANVVRYLVIRTGSWLAPGNWVVISPISIEKVDNEEGVIHVNLSAEQIKNSPALSEHEPVSKQYENRFFKYYGYSVYWMGGGLWGAFPHPGALADISKANSRLSDSESESTSEGESKLRAFSEVKGYAVDTIDGKVGHLENCLVNENDWSLAFYVVNTRNWLPGGKQVLLSPMRVSEIKWAESSILVVLSTRELKESPEYDPSVDYGSDDWATQQVYLHGKNSHGLGNEHQYRKNL